jgi:hypothetical protein
MPPEYELRVKLNQAAKEWVSVIGSLLGGQSAPIDLSDGELLVVAETPLVASRLSMMSGNIARAIRQRWHMEVAKVKVVVGRLPLKSTKLESTISKSAESQKHTSHAPFIGVREEDAQKLARHYLEKSPDLPEDIVESLAHLQAFFTKRFPSLTSR